MRPELIEFFKSKSLDNVQGISELRNGNEAVFRQAVSGARTPGRSSERTRAEWLENSVNMWGRNRDNFLYNKLDPTLIDITKSYYLGINSWFGPRPIEFFLLNKTYRELYSGKLSKEKLLSYMEIPFLKEIVIDTGNYVITGERDIHVHSLRGIVEEYWLDRKKDYRYNYIPDLNIKPRFKWEDIGELSSSEFFSKWISQPYGKEDLITTHRLALGF